MNTEYAKNHISRDRQEETTNDFPKQKLTYDIYTCDYCEKEFHIDARFDTHHVYREAMDHLREEHPDELSREPYKNEEAFREWVDEMPGSLQEPFNPGDPVVYAFGDGKQVLLHKGGQVVLQQIRPLGGVNDEDDVRVEGGRLVVEDGQGNVSYVSSNAYPIDQ